LRYRWREVELLRPHSRYAIQVGAGSVECEPAIAVNDFERRVDEILKSPLSRERRAHALAQSIQAEREFHWVGLYDVSDTTISAIAWTGAIAPAFPSFPIDKGLNGSAVAQGNPVVVQDVSKDSRYLTTFGPTKAEAIFPIFAPGRRVVGTIDVEAERVAAFEAADIAFLEKCATLIAPLWA
jgi:putative methionine-R-sulfoxide reductase with GAF domain